jgi:hypothetical protein
VAIRPKAGQHCVLPVLLLLQKKAKKKKKPRFPKGYDPSLPNGGLPLPDPERWLPKWQRSDYKKKQKRRRDRTVGAQPVLAVAAVWLQGRQVVLHACAHPCRGSVHSPNASLLLV